MTRRLLVTGGAGFIGSNLIRYWLEKYPSDEIVNLDCLTYAARHDFVLDFLADRPDLKGRYFFELCDIRDRGSVQYCVDHHKPDFAIHLAAESHVCRSIAGPEAFFSTNVMGTFNLLEVLKNYWKDSKAAHFHHVSTDEVFGELQESDPPFNEQNALKPRSPYACSKAASDMMVETYRDTYGMNITISNCSNNYGPNQHDEKLIPGTLARFLKEQPAKIYGSGRQIRDWLHVKDHCRALDRIMHFGTKGHRYCIGGETELRNTTVIEEIWNLLWKMGLVRGDCPVELTNDRPTDDHRYAIDISKMVQLGWKPQISFAEGLSETIDWYRAKMEQGAGRLRGIGKQGGEPV